MTIKQLRKLLADLPADHEVLFHDTHGQCLEPAELFAWIDLRPGDPLRLKLPPNAILISGTGDPVTAH
jgi:hypothetical protein